MKYKIHYTLYLFFLISFFCGFLYQVILMFLILLLHELGHLYFLKKYKREIKSITFFPFGGVINHSSSYNGNINEDFLIEFGGLFMNIIFLFIFKLLNFQLLLLINYGILVFNIIPIYPLDGSKIIKTLLCKFLSYKRTLYVSFIISIITILLICLVNILYINSFYIYFLLIALININIKKIKGIKKEYHLFLTNKYIYPNCKLKCKEIKRFNKPLNSLFFGKNNIFIIDDIKVKEEVFLQKKFS